jgi:hypothetical protein
MKVDAFTEIVADTHIAWKQVAANPLLTMAANPLLAVAQQMHAPILSSLPTCLNNGPLSSGSGRNNANEMLLVIMSEIFRGQNTPFWCMHQ